MKVTLGKRVAGNTYLHRSALPLADPASQSAVEVALRFAGMVEWNVVRVAKRSVSFLLYDSFDEAAFPAVCFSTKVDLVTGKVSRLDYRDRANPPILHRKELLLPPDDPRLPTFRAVTSAAEEHGLFADVSRIGTKRSWEERIAKAGLVLRGHQLLPANEEHVAVARHRTAIVRRDLSLPMQLMIRYGLVTVDRSIFDFGCGQGEDIAALSGQGYEAFGWDPYHAPDGPRKAADVVNLGYVLNVIEAPLERVETLRSAWSFAKRSLCVSVMPIGKSSVALQKPYRDGYVTSRGTFQKYFEQQELQKLVEEVTGEKPIAFASGIVAVFRDKDLEQEVLFRRHSRLFVFNRIPKPPPRERVVVARPVLRERVSLELDQLRARSYELGRFPDQDEAEPDTIETLTANRVSWSRVIGFLGEMLAEDDTFKRAQQLRREDLLVHLALMQFPGAPKYRHLPRSIQTDLKCFFKSHNAALDESRRLLFAAGDREGVRVDAEEAISTGLGGKRGEHHFRFRSNVLSRLPPRLRVLVGSAEVLQGGVDSCDFVEIDLTSPRVIMINCDDVEQPVPFVIERTLVDLGRLKVSTDRRDGDTMPIYFKSRFLPVDDERRAEQLVFEERLTRTGLFVEGQRDPEWVAVKRELGIN
jgi:DNA phosphorothioation-associated putative methyltransferase